MFIKKAHIATIFFYYIGILLLCCSAGIYAQTQRESTTLLATVKQKGIAYKSEQHFYKAHKFFLQENWDSVLVYSMKQLSYKKNSEITDYCHYFRAISFKKKGLFEEAKNEFKRISESFEFYHKVRLSLGEILLEKGDFKGAITYFDEVERVEDKQARDFKKSNVIHNLGLCYLHLGEFDKAEECLLKSFELQKAEKDTLAIIGSYMDIATLYYEQYKDDMAILNFEKAYQLSHKVNDFNLKQNAAMNMAVVEENRGDFDSALLYRKEYEQWRDSLNNQNKVWALAELEKKFALEQKQEEVNALVTENKLKRAERNGLIYASLLLLAILLAGIYFYLQKVKSNKIIRAQKVQLDILNATKDKLFSIVSHDLRSSVYALKSSNAKLLENFDARNFDALDKLLHTNTTIANSTYNLLDNLLNWALLQTKQSYFKKEAVRLFFIAEQVAYNYKALMQEKNISFAINVPTNVVIYADIESLKIILRNLLDNAIKFTGSNGKITIYSRERDEEYYDIIVEDNGRGMSKEVCERLMEENNLLAMKKKESEIGTGLGMQLCKSFVKKNNGFFAIESEENIGTKIIISLPKSHKNG